MANNNLDNINLNNLKSFNDILRLNTAGLSGYGSAQQKLIDEEKNKKSHEAIVTITAITMDLLSHTIEYIKVNNELVKQTDFILEFLQNCDKNIYIDIRDYHGKLKDQSKLEPQKIKCIHCQHEYSQDIVINQTDFFG